MSIHYRKADGNHAELPNVGALRRLFDSGEIRRDSQIYDSLRGGWCRADEHSATRQWFPPEVGSEAPARPVGAPRPPSPPVIAPKPWAQAAYSPAPREYWNLGFIPALLLAGLIVLNLAAPHLPAGASAILNVGGACVALATLLAVSLVGMASAFSRVPTHHALAGMSALPLIAFGLFAFLLFQKPAKPNKPAPPASVADASPTMAVRSPVIPSPVTQAPTQRPDVPPSVPDLDKALTKFKMKVEGEQGNLVFRINQESLSAYFALVNIHNPSAIRICRTKLTAISGYMDTFIRNVEGAFDTLALEVEAPLSGKARQEADLEFKIAKEMALGDLKEFFRMIKNHNSDADRMLSFMEGLADVGSPSNADILTLQLYQSRLKDTSSQLDEMAKELDARMIRAQAGLRERLSRSTSRPD